MRIALGGDPHFLQWSSLHILPKFPTVLRLPKPLPLSHGKALRDRPEQPGPTAAPDTVCGIRRLYRPGRAWGRMPARKSPIVFWKRHKLVSAEAILSGLGTD